MRIVLTQHFPLWISGPLGRSFFLRMKRSVSLTVDSFRNAYIRNFHSPFLHCYKRKKTMHFIDALIPLFGGIYLLVSEGRLLKPMDPSYQRKKRLLKRSAYGLILISIGYFIISLFAWSVEWKVNCCKSFLSKLNREPKHNAISQGS